jgi:hypothetical protein
MAKSRKVDSEKLELCDGVGFRPNLVRGDHRPHYVVLMQSMHSGTEVFGPFVTEKDAYMWINEHGDGEVYSHFSRSRVDGVTFHVKWLDIPTKQSW